MLSEQSLLSLGDDELEMSRDRKRSIMRAYKPYLHQHCPRRQNVQAGMHQDIRAYLETWESTFHRSSAVIQIQTALPTSHSPAQLPRCGQIVQHIRATPLRQC